MQLDDAESKLNLFAGIGREQHGDGCKCQFCRIREIRRASFSIKSRDGNSTMTEKQLDEAMDDLERTAIESVRERDETIAELREAIRQHVAKAKGRLYQVDTEDLKAALAKGE